MKSLLFWQAAMNNDVLLYVCMLRKFPLIALDIGLFYCNSNHILLTLSDHLTWTENEENPTHLLCLFVWRLMISGAFYLFVFEHQRLICIVNTKKYQQHQRRKKKELNELHFGLLRVKHTANALQIHF